MGKLQPGYIRLKYWDIFGTNGKSMVLSVPILQYFRVFLDGNICCNASLELTQCDSSNEE